jgi:sarcosine oxidase, subunit beta
MSDVVRPVAAGKRSRGAQVIVIGGGVTGLSAAWWLAREGVDVQVLESSLVGFEASGRNGGGCSHHFSPFFKEEQRLWPQMDELLGYPTEFQPNRIRIAFSEHQMALYGQAMRNAARHGFNSEILDARQIQEQVPLSGGDAVGGYYYRFGGHANPHRTIQAYAWAIQDHSGRIMQQTRVRGFRRLGGRVTAVLTEREEIGCDSVVIAAGPAIGNLSAMLDMHVPMAAARAEMIVTEPLPLMPLGGVDGNGLYGRQTLRGNLAYGGGPHEWIEFGGTTAPAKPSTPLMRNISARLAQLFPRAAHARVIRSWAGVIENTPDGRPIIDRPEQYENVVLATLSSIGFGLSPATGRAVRDLIVDGACGFADISSFALSRFAGLEPDWQELQGWRAAVPT